MLYQLMSVKHYNLNIKTVIPKNKTKGYTEMLSLKLALIILIFSGL